MARASKYLYVEIYL